MKIAEIKRGLTTKFIGQNIYFYQQIDSTNEEAIRQVVKNDVAEGTLILAEFQTAGRGKHGRNWLAPARSSILCSIILYPEIDYKKQSIVTLLTAVAVARSLHSMTGLEASVKWPNDVIISDRKVCGILTEAGPMNSLIIGFGINVNIDQESMPQALRKTATSVQILLGHELSRTKLLRSLLVNFENLYILLENGKPGRILNELRNMSSTIGRHVSIKRDNRIISGKVLTIEDDGSLLVRSEDKTFERIYTGEITDET